ncbi:acyl-CoA dehydrogenase family protein [Pigmentiphaga aceris]|uniref:Acyl-CoA dehydrogenase family protein n=1 Tax=Pigmentiphaga aceris TaxID=1940612 RepID=A0A5C0B4S2_9BURK|nr:acyl-CoA dehydrogenase family protein [Pigmentiphaga aceris]QEI09014.1 acyl-CoA dehydrogenase family protein [Pigmentiphaga aceris]
MSALAQAPLAPQPYPTREQLLARLPVLAQQIAIGAADRERLHDLPFDAFAKFRESGLGALRIPVEQGGPGGSLVDVFHVIVTLAAADSNVAHALRLHYDLTEALALQRPTPFTAVQVRRVLDGAIFGGASTERETAKPGEFQTVLRRQGDHFVVSGRKFYSTGTAFSDYARINMLNEAGDYVIVIIPVSRQGVRIIDDWNGMGQRLTASGSLLLDEVEVYDDEVVPREYENLPGRHNGALRQLHLVATASGIVHNVLADALSYVRHHGRPAAHSGVDSPRDDVFIHQVIGDLASYAHAIDALVEQNARTLDRSAVAIAAGHADAEERVLEGALATAQTQLIVSKLALQAAERLFEAGGASATSTTHNFDRHWRNLRTIFSHNPLLHKARVIGDYHLNGVTTHLKEGRVF